MDVIDVESMLQDMRYYRMGLVQTPDQLRFSFLSIIDGGKQILSNPPPSKENEIDTVSLSYGYLTALFLVLNICSHIRTHTHHHHV